MFLTSSSNAIEALLSASSTNPVTLESAYYDDPVSAGTPIGSVETSVNSTTPVTLVAAPSSGIGRAVHMILAHNPNVSSVELTIRRVGGAVIYKGTLAASKTLFWPFRGEPVIL